MTEQTERTEILVGPLVRVALYGADDLEVAFSELNEVAHTEHDPASVADADVIDLVATHMDVSLDELARRVYGRDSGGKLEVGRPETGNIMVRPETVLGRIYDDGEKIATQEYFSDMSCENKDCKHDSHKFNIYPSCHDDACMWIRVDTDNPGEVIVLCSVCGTETMRIAVAKAENL